MNSYNERHQDMQPTPSYRPQVPTQRTENPVQVVDSDDDDVSCTVQSQVSLTTSTSMPLEMLGLTEISSDDEDEFHQQTMSQLSLRQHNASLPSGSFPQPKSQLRGHYSTLNFKKEPKGIPHSQPQSKPLSARSPKKDLKFVSYMTPSQKVQSSPSKTDPTSRDQDLRPSEKTTQRRKLPGTILAHPTDTILAPIPRVIQKATSEVMPDVKPLMSSEKQVFSEESTFMEELLGRPAQVPRSPERSYPSGKSSIYSERDSYPDEEVGEQDTAQDDADWSPDMARSSSPSPWRNSPQANLPFLETLLPGQPWSGRDEDSLLVEESLDTIPPGQGRPNTQLGYHGSSLELSDEDDLVVGRMVSASMRKQDHNRNFPEERLPVDLDMHIPEKILSQRATDTGPMSDRPNHGFVGAINSVISSLFSSVSQGRTDVHRRIPDEAEETLERHTQRAGSAGTGAPEDEAGEDYPEQTIEEESVLARPDSLGPAPILLGDMRPTGTVQLEQEQEEDSRVGTAKTSTVKEEAREREVTEERLEEHGEDEALFLEALGLLNGSVVATGGTNRGDMERLAPTNVNEEEQGGHEVVEAVVLHGSNESRGDVEDSQVEILEAVEIETVHSAITKESETNHPTTPASIPSRTRRAHADDTHGHTSKRVKWSTDPCTEFYMDNLNETKDVPSNTSDTDDDKQQRTRLLLYLGNKYKDQIRKMTVLELVPKLTAIDILDACSGNLKAARQYMRKGLNGKEKPIL